MKINRYVVGEVQTNCYIIINEETQECLIADPGAAARQLASRIRRDGLKPVAVLLTHGHFDHAGAAKELAEEFGILVYAHEAEGDTLKDPRKNVSWMAGKEERYAADVYVKEKEELDLAGFAIQVIHTPGHTKGGCCYYFKEKQVLFSGDTLFARSVGRTDFPGGSMSELVRSIREKLMILPDETIVYPGHDDATDIKTEKEHNPYL
uniref:MBL fold metallo-hydrolase n=1 Tax=Agathobacter sp. TaxID=2021311 RepID=UPI004055A4A4